MSRYREILFTLVACALFGNPMQAQGRGTLRVPDWVHVDPIDGGPLRYGPSTTTSLTFTVSSLYPGLTTYALSCNPVGAVVSCTPAETSLDMGYGDTIQVLVEMTTIGSDGVAGELQLTATGPATNTGNYFIETGSLSAPVIAIPRQPLLVSDRGVCPTVGAGVATWSCGDALLLLATPVVTTLDRGRGMTLAMNSSTASPHPWAMAEVSVASDNPPLTHITAELKVLDTVRTSVRYIPWFGAKQIVVGWPAAGRRTGIYPYKLTIRNVTTSDSMIADYDGYLHVVNRDSSVYGRGTEWLGIERLVLNQPVGTANGDIMWVGGDGSSRLYQKLNSTTWVAPAEAFRDTIVYAGSEYTRNLQHGAQVVFDNTGRHVRTISRTAQVTTFYWGSATGLDSVRVPPAGSGGQTIVFRYNGAGGLLDSVQVGTGQGAGMTQSSGRMTQWRWPDGTLLNFSYDTAGRMVRTIDDRSDTTWLTYGVHGLVTHSRQKLNATDTALTVFEPWQREGYVIGAGWQEGGDTAASVTWITGPRGERARFRVDRWQAPVALTDPTGQTTRYVRADTLVPALVTSIQYPNARRAMMTYNTRGNLLTLTDSTWGSRAFPKLVTTWTYGDAAAPDSPTSVVDPAGVTTSFWYGNYQMPDSTIDGRGLKTSFVIASADSIRGQLLTTTDHAVRTWVQSDTLAQPIDLVTTWTYDIRGNSKTVTNPAGARTKYTRDTQGRITRADDPVGMRTDLVYDVMSRVTQRTLVDVVGDTSSACLTTNFVCNAGNSIVLDGLNPSGGDATSTATYTNGLLTQVTDPRSVLQSYRYDLAGRLIAQLDEAGAKDSAVYNKSSQITRQRTRMNLNVDTWYDIDGRDTMRVIPPRTVTYRTATDSSRADTVKVIYDSLGNVLSTRNRSGTIRRGYYENGSLRYEVTVPDNLKMIQDSVAYQYDAGGRVRRIAWTNTDSIIYSYHGSSGDLSQMDVWLRTNSTQRHETWGFIWDQLGRRDSIIYPFLAMGVSYAYDRAGTLRRVRSGNSSLLTPNRFNFTFMQDSVDVMGRPLRQILDCYGQTGFGLACGQWLPKKTGWRYNRWGQLVLTMQPELPAALDSVFYDQSGNRIAMHGLEKMRKYIYPSASNRMTSDSIRNRLGPPTYSGVSYTFAADGGQARRLHAVSGDTTDQVWQYDGLGRLVGGGRYFHSGASVIVDSAFNHCHWDGENRASLPCDGSHLGYVGSNATRTGSGWFFVHAPGIDEALMLIYRNPNNNWQVDVRLQAVTDGRGQLLAIADSSGYIDSTATWWSAGYGMGEWRGAGLTTRGQTFEPKRWETDDRWGEVQQFRNRAYDPSSGRWLQEDPIGLAGGINLYSYNGNNPATFRDPFGLCPPKDEDYSTCEPGSPGWYANRRVTGQGNPILNEVGGWLSTCGESLLCLGALGVTGGVALRARILAARAAAAAEVVEPSAGMLKEFGRILSEKGRASVEKSIRSLQQRLEEHVTKLDEIRRKGGYTSSVEKEIRTFSRQIEAAKRVLKKGGG